MLAWIGGLLAACQPNTPPPSTTRPPTPTAAPSAPPATAMEQATETVAATEIPYKFPDPILTTLEGAPDTDAFRQAGSGYIRAASLSPDEATLAVGTTTGLYAYALPGWALVWAHVTHTPVNAVIWAEDSGHAGIFLEPFPFFRFPEGILFDAQGTEVERFTGPTYPEWFHPKQLLPIPEGGMGVQATDKPRVLNLIDQATGEMLFALDHPPDEGGPFIPIGDWKFNADQSYLATYAAFRPSPTDTAIPALETVYVWDTSSGELAQMLGHKGAVLDVVWLPDGEHLVVSSQYEVALWNIRVGKLLQAIEAGVPHIALSPDGDRLAILSGGASYGKSVPVSVAVVDIDSHEVTHFPDPQLVEDFAYDLRPIWRDGGDRLITPLGTRIIEWNARSGTPLFQLQTAISADEIRSGQDGLTAALVERDGPDRVRRVWVADYDGRMTLATEEAVAGWEGYGLDEISPRHNVPEIEIETSSPQGRYIALGVMGLHEGECVEEEAPDTVIKIIDQALDRELFEIRRDCIGIGAMAFAPNDTMLAVGHDPYRFSVKLNEWGANESVISLWDMKSGELIADWYGHAGGVRRIFWFADSLRFFSLSTDGTVLFWDVAGKEAPTGDQVAPAAR